VERRESKSLDWVPIRRHVFSDAAAEDLRSCTSTASYVFMAWWLIKHRDNFTFTYCRSLAVETEYYNVEDIRRLLEDFWH
jgi:hypothetical protein